jgi:deoxyribose-phosphate aldolase
LAEAQAVRGHGEGKAGSPVELTTALAFEFDDDALPSVDALLEEARRLRGQGATDLAIIANRPRLSPDMVAFERTLTALCEEEALDGGRIRVHLDTTDLRTTQLAEAAARFERAGAWMIQVGTWQGEGPGFTQTQVVRRAVSTHVLVKWDYPIQTPATLLLSASEGIDRFNAVAPGALVRQAQRISDSGWLTVPAEGVDY